jgi:predicted molibdopterin-dependent oxidoreductase YjgC
VQGRFKAVSWDKAIEHVYKKIKDLSHQEILFIGSGKIPNEDNYVIEKFARIIYGANCVDACCTRLCHESTVRATRDVYGIPNASRVENVDKIDTIFVVGSNPAINYPVFWNKFLRRKNKIRLMGVSSVMSETLKQCHTAVLIEPGTDLVLLNGIMKALIDSNKHDKNAEKTEGFGILKKIVQNFTKDIVCTTCKITLEEFDRLVNEIAKSKAFAASHGMGYTQHVNGVENVRSLLNLVNLKGGEIMNLRGEVNVQGVGDMACIPERLPTGTLETGQKLELLWKTKAPQDTGKNLVEAMLISPVKALIMSNFHPSHSMPNVNKIEGMLSTAFVVGMESHQHDTYSRFADVILPTPTLTEREGTITNGERRVRKVNKVVQPPNEAVPEWKILQKLSKKFGKAKYFAYKNEKEILQEIKRVVLDYRDIDAEKLWAGQDQWADKEKKWKRFVAEPFRGIDDVRSEQYPFILNVYRSKWNFLTAEQTGLSPTLMKYEPKPHFYLSPADCKKLRLKDGDKIIVTSEAGSVSAPAKPNPDVPSGLVTTTFHSTKLPVNKLFPTRFDRLTFTPNYRVVAVKVEKTKGK